MLCKFWATTDLQFFAMLCKFWADMYPFAVQKHSTAA